MSWVSNTGPIIALAKVRKLSLLRSLVGEVWIPPIVHRELYGKLDEDTPVIEKALSSFISVHEPGAVEKAAGALLMGLDAGERQVVELALTAGPDPIVLMDDYAGREMAKRFRLRLTGTVGLLLQAKEQRLIGEVVEVLHRIRQNGYWLSDEVIETARILARE